MELEITKTEDKREAKIDYSSIRDPRVVKEFAQEVGRQKPSADFFKEVDNLDLASRSLTGALYTAAQSVLPEKIFEAQKP